MDYQALLYNPIYSGLGVAAVIDTGSDGPVSVTVIDKTAGIAVGDGVEVQSIKPACDVRMAELAANGLDRADVNEMPITFNGKTWTIAQTEARPSPRGEADGELRLFLNA